MARCSGPPLWTQGSSVRVDREADVLQEDGARVCNALGAPTRVCFILPQLRLRLVGPATCTYTVERECSRRINQGSIRPHAHANAANLVQNTTTATHFEREGECSVNRMMVLCETDPSVSYIAGGDTCNAAEKYHGGHQAGLLAELLANGPASYTLLH